MTKGSVKAKDLLDNHLELRFPQRKLNLDFANCDEFNASQENTMSEGFFNTYFFGLVGSTKKSRSLKLLVSLSWSPK